MAGVRLISWLGVNIPMTSSVSLKPYLAAFLPFGPFGFEYRGISAADICYSHNFPPFGSLVLFGVGADGRQDD